MLAERRLITSNTPFSIKNNWQVKWAKNDADWKGIQRGRAFLTERDFYTLQAVKGIGYATNLQIAKLLSASIKKGKERLYKLERMGFFLEHKLYSDHRNSTTFYSLGPNCRGIIKGFNAPEKEHPDIFIILESLSVFQLLVRFKEKVEHVYVKDGNKKIKEIVINNNVFKVISLRGNFDKYKEILTRLEGRYIVILESQHQIAEVSELIDKSLSIRYTTDDNLIKTPIYEAFYKVEKGEVIRDLAKV